MVRDIDGKGLLTTGQCAEAGHRPVETTQAQQAFYKPARLPERHAKQNLHRQAGLIAVSSQVC